MAGPLLFDRIKETTTSVGTPSFTLAGAPIGFSTVGSVLANGDISFFSAVHQTLNEWEVFRGTYSGGVISVDSVFSSANSGNTPVNFSAGTKNTFITVPAAMSGRTWTLAGTWTYSSDVTEVIFLNLGGYTDIMVFLKSVTASTAVSRHIQVSSDNGSSYYSGATDYSTFNAAGVEGNASAIVPHTTAATTVKTCAVTIHTWNVATGFKFIDRHNILTDPRCQHFTQAVALNALKVLLSGAGNLTGGSIYVYGR